MNKDNKRSLPPVIRVFLSSTFADMDKERSYFNEVLVPKINRICSDRGVSFFSVDLRWGITEEEQINGKVLPICLSEIDKCRPYFIGMLGNRYGSLLETVPDNIAKVIPWLAGKEGHSITELEMLYAVLEHNDEKTLANSAFYIRSDELTSLLYGDLKEESESALENLKRLKRTIEEDNDTPCSHYSSIEEFGQFVMRDILNWLDMNFPESEDIDAIRSEWYNSEILRNHIENTGLNSFLNSYIKESGKPLLIYGDGARGKTASLTAWTPDVGHKILVNCGADDKFSYWPSIVDEIVNQLNVVAPLLDEGSRAKIVEISSEIDHHKNDMWSKIQGKKEMFFLAESVIERFRRTVLKWFTEFNPNENITIIINDLNLLDEERSKLLGWLPSSTRGRMKIICSSNDDDMVDHAETLGWNIKEMPLLEAEPASRFVKQYLGSFGKSFSSTQMNMLLNSHAAKFPGLLRFIIRFLINYGRFENLDELISELSRCDDIQQIYLFIYNYLIKDYSDNERKIARVVLGIVRLSRISLRENECFDLAKQSCDISPIEWANICRAFEQLELVHGDYWNIRNEETEKFIDRLLTDDEIARAHLTLGDFIMGQLNIRNNGVDKLSPRMGARYSKAAFVHYRSASAWDKLEDALGKRVILEYLYMPDWSAVRAEWMQLLLHTDKDVVAKISQLAGEYLALEEYFNRRIGKMLVGLLIDFEFNSQADALCQSIGIDNPGGTVDGLHSSVSEEVFNLINQVKFLQQRQDYRSIFEFLNGFLKLDNQISDIERCELLFVLSNAYMRSAYYEEALEVANEYYSLALKAGFFFELRRALGMRKSTLFHLGRYDEALKIIDRTSSMAINEGEIRTYLGDMNTKAMIYYRHDRCDEAVAIFDGIIKIWSKIGDLYETAVATINRANALSYNDDYVSALASAEEFYDKIKDNSELIFISATLLGNMGSYALSCNELDKAERYLNEAVAIAKARSFESLLIKAYNALNRLYTKTDNIGKKFEVCEEKMHLFWKRREYNELIETLNGYIEHLLIVKHNARADEILEYWKNMFSKIEGGDRYFEEHINGKIVDTLSIEALEEQLVVAKSEGNIDAIIKAYTSLVAAIGDSDYQRAVDYILAAIKILSDNGREDLIAKQVATAASLLIKNGVTIDGQLLLKLADSLEDENYLKIITLWMLPSGKAEVDISEVADGLTSFGREYEPLVAMALVDLKHYLVDSLDASKLIALVNGMLEDDSKLKVATAIETVMLENNQQNEAKLIEDYMSSEAEALIAHFEKCIAFLNVFDKGNAATYAGNIAIIFRRRKEKDKTLYYHKMSMDLFSEQNKPRDRLIEMTNLATAYSEFDEEDKCIELLREALDYAAEVNDRLQRALVADNLADFLRKRGLDEDREEILKCFEIGESFFRSSGHYRDLVISLRNQAIYLSTKAPREVWESKIREARAIADQHGLTEFDQGLQTLEWMLNQQKEIKPVTMDEARERVVKMLECVRDGATIHKEEEAGDYYRFFVLPNQQYGGREEFHIMCKKDDASLIHVIFAFLPNLEADNLPALTDYMNWCNQLGPYQLSWKESGYLGAYAVLRFSDDDVMCTQMANSYCNWTLDKTATLAIFGQSIDNVKEIQGMRLKLHAI